MNQKSVLIIGATGHLGKPVVKEFIAAGYQVRALVRRPNLARPQLPAGVELITGDIFDEKSLRAAIREGDLIYLNLSVAQNESKSQMHTEQEGLETLLRIAREKKVTRVGFLSSIVRKYNGMNGFSWWVFDVKIAGTEILKKSGVPYFIYNPSTFMDNFLGPQKMGNKIALSGTSKFPMWYISGADYGKQVVKSFELSHLPSREFSIQGLEGFIADEAAKVFTENYTREKLGIMKAPIGLFKGLGLFSRPMNFLAHIMTALNNYPEQFESKETWEILGKPTETLASYARRVSG